MLATNYIISEKWQLILHIRLRIDPASLEKYYLFDTDVILTSLKGWQKLQIFQAHLC